MMDGGVLVFQVFHKASCGTFDKQDKTAYSGRTNVLRTKKLNMNGQAYSVISSKNLANAFRSMLYRRYGAHIPLLPYIIDPSSFKMSEIESLIDTYTQAPEYQIMGGLTRNHLDIVHKHACLRFTDSISLFPYHYDTLFHTNGGLIKHCNRNGNNDFNNAIYIKEVHVSYYTFSAVLNTRFLPQDIKMELVSMVFNTLFDGITYTRGGIMQSTAPFIFIVALAKRDEPTFHNGYVLCKRDNYNVVVLQDAVLKSDNFIYENGKILGLVIDTHQLRLDNAQNIFAYYGEEGYRNFIKRYSL